MKVLPEVLTRSGAIRSLESHAAVCLTRLPSDVRFRFCGFLVSPLVMDNWSYNRKYRRLVCKYTKYIHFQGERMGLELWCTGFFIPQRHSCEMNDQGRKGCGQLRVLTPQRQTIRRTQTTLFAYDSHCMCIRTCVCPRSLINMCYTSQEGYSYLGVTNTQNHSLVDDTSLYNPLCTVHQP